MENKITREIRKCSKVFTKSLHLENEVFMDQLNQTVTLTVHAMEELMRLNSLGGTLAIGTKQGHVLVADLAQQALIELEQKMHNTMQNIKDLAGAEQTVVLGSSDDPWKNAAEHFNTSMQNAVSAQQQMNIVSRAAMVECVNSILHTVPPMLANINRSSGA